MKKKNRVLRIGLLALVLTLVTASLVSGTFAKYVTTVSGTGTVQVAKWNAILKKGDTEKGTANFEDATAFDLFDTMSGIGDVSQSNGKRVAPGTAGSFKLEYNTIGTEVQHAVKLVLSKAGAGTLPTNMTLTLTTTGFTENLNNEPIKDLANKTFTKEYAKDSNGGQGTVLVSWSWPIGPYTNNVQDTKDGHDLAGKEFTINAAFEAIQVDSVPVG